MQKLKNKEFERMLRFVFGVGDFVLFWCLWEIYKFLLGLLWIRSYLRSPGLCWDAMLKITGVILHHFQHKIHEDLSSFYRWTMSETLSIDGFQLIDDIEKFYVNKYSNISTKVPNLYGKERYVLHYEHLQLYLEWRMKFKKNS